MVRVDWNDPGEGGEFLAPGAYLAEVKECEERQGPKGPYFNARFDALNRGQHLCYDVLSFSQKAWGMTQKKLRALGFSESQEVIEPHHLVGKRAWLAVGEEEYEDRDGKVRKSLKVDIRAEGSSCGYWHEKDGPTSNDSDSEPTAADVAPSSFDDLDTPF